MRMNEGFPSVISRITPARLDEIRRKYHLGPELEAEAPDEFHPIFDPPTGKVGVYLLYLEGGLRFPVSEFFKSVLTFYDVHISQLDPTAVHKIISYELCCRALGYDKSLIGTSLIGFRYFYNMKQSAKYWVKFPVRKHHTDICAGSNYFPKEWKEDYLFIRADFFPGNMSIRTNRRPDIDKMPKLSPGDLNSVKEIERNFVMSHNLPEVVLAAARMTPVPRFKVNYEITLIQMLKELIHRQREISIVEEEAPPPPEQGDLQENVDEA